MPLGMPLVRVVGAGEATTDTTVPRSWSCSGAAHDSPSRCFRKCCSNTAAEVAWLGGYLLLERVLTISHKYAISKFMRRLFKDGHYIEISEPLLCLRLSDMVREK